MSTTPAMPDPQPQGQPRKIVIGTTPERTEVPPSEPLPEYRLKPGEMVGTDYRILEPLGAGAMGEVYKAENVHDHKLFALKIFSPDLCADERLVQQFHVEARVLADLDHPNIVRLYHHSVDPGRHLPYLTMEYVRGPGGRPRTLQQELAAAPGRKLPEPKVRKLALQLCEALAYAHGLGEEGVVHRDLKPGNILLDERDNAQISDFGLVKVLGRDYLRAITERSVLQSLRGRGPSGPRLDGTPSPERPPSSDTLVGNLMFMSPEQRDGAEATKQSDLYALGAILYYLLTGSRAEGRWKLPSELGLSRAWDEVVKTCLEPVVKERIGSAEALRVLIERTAARGAGMRRGLLIAAALLTVGLCAGLVFRWGSGDGRDPAPHGDSAAARAHPTTRGTGILPVPPAVPPTTTTTVIPIPPPTTTTLPPPAPAVALRDVAPLKADADLKLPEILKVPDGQGFEALKTPLPAVPDAAAQAGPAVGVVIVTLGALAAVAAIVLVAGVIAVRRNLSRRDG